MLGNPNKIQEELLGTQDWTDEESKEWIQQDFSIQAFLKWREVGAFDPAKVKTLQRLGINPEDVAYTVTEAEVAEGSFPYAGDTIASTFCKDDLTLEDIEHLVLSAL